MANLSNINNKFIVEDSGDVGIGVTTATTKLHIGGTAPGDSIIRQDSTVSGTNWEIGERAAGKWQIFEDDGDTIVATFMSSGNVGIGTASPSRGPLHINENSSGYCQVHLTNDTSGTTSGDGLTLFTNGADAGLMQRENSYLLFGTNDTERMRIDSSGKIGVSNTNPSAFNSLGATAQIVIGNASSVSNLTMYSSSTGYGSVSFADSNSSSSSSQYSGLIQYYQANNSMAFYTASTERMRIDGSGNVGIGTNSPGSKLTINETSTATAAVNIVTARYGISLQGAGATSNSQYLLNLQSDGGAKEVMRVQSSGNVGIGTTSPIGKLTVQGDDADIYLRSNDYTIARIINRGSSGQNLDTGLFSLMYSNTENVRIDAGGNSWFNGGNVGIGTTSPSSKLHVTGAPANGVYLSYLYNSATHNSANGLNVQTSSNNILTYGLRVNTAGDSNALAVMGNGSVGIGTASPDYKLEVQGVISSADSALQKATFANVGADLVLTANADATNVTAKILFNSSGSGGAGVSTKMIIDGSGNVGIGTTSPTVKLDVRTDNGVLIKGASGSTNGKLSFLPASGGRQYDFRNAGSSFVIHDASAGTDRMYFHYNGNLGIGTTSPYSLLDVDGAITNGSATNDSNISTSTTAFSQQDGGALHITWGLGGNAASGSTIVFTYAATSWKSWTLKYNFASTNGITQGVIGGYWNNSGGNQNSEDIDNLGCSAAVTHGGTGNQNIIVTFTFTALGTHPMANFVYMQAGGDGHPRADRVSIQGNNAV